MPHRFSAEQCYRGIIQIALSSHIILARAELTKANQDIRQVQFVLPIHAWCLALTRVWTSPQKPHPLKKPTFPFPGTSTDNSFLESSETLRNQKLNDV